MMSHIPSPWKRKGAMFCNALARPLVGLGLLLGKLSSWLILFIMVSVLVAVALNFLRINEILNWGVEAPLFGEGITINSMIDLQWHLFGVFTFLGGAYALHHNTHVRVDLVYQRLSIRGRALVDIIGHSFLLLPFCILTAWFSKNFVMMAYVSGEGSSFGGLVDRYLIKSMVPAGMLLVSIGAVGEILKNIAVLLDPPIESGNDMKPSSFINAGDHDVG